MKQFFTGVLLLFLCLQLQAQTLSGKVYRAGTDSVIAGASVYYGGSMQGTITDGGGRFEMPARQQQVPVIVSCIGYYSSTVNYVPGKPLIVYLKPKIEELHTVTIRADGMYRKDEVAMFIRDFLGTSDYAKSCTITNMDDVDLFFDIKTQTLNATAEKPLVIENKKLGYTVSYYMDKFADAADDINIQGNYIFKENVPPADAGKIKRNRENAYEGSRMQFIRALWHRSLDKTGFALQRLGLPITEDSVLVADSSGQKYIRWNHTLNFNHYRSFSYLVLQKDRYFIDKNGFYDSSLEWGGNIGRQRIGDLLPFEYQPENEQKEFASLPGDVKPAPVMVANPVVAEKPVNNSPLVFEKVYLHTDRDVYAKGDTLWFKAYLVNAQNNKSAGSSGNLHVEVISPDAKIISSELIRLDKGSGNGDFELADSLAAGKYHLRAYTNWMRNFGDNFIFDKEITILNTEAIPATADLKTNPAKVTAAKTPAVNNTSVSDQVTSTVRFYPEGGSLVDGISSLVAVKAEDGFGKGLAAQGVVLTASGDTLTKFVCDTLGMGMFTLLPVKGQFYHASMSGNLKNKMFGLPQALSSGFTLQVRQTDSVIRAVISANNEAVSALCKLTVKHGGITLLSQSLQVTGQTPARIATATLPEGIAAITVYDDHGKPNCERLVYIHHPNAVNVIVNTDKKAYQPKEQVKLAISAKAAANLSIAVIDAGIVPEQADDIVSYLMLGSELKGHIEQAHRYFDTTNINRFKQLDLLLMTQGWRDFVWRRMADTAIRISYAAENGIGLSGRVWDEVNNKYMAGLNISLYAPAARGNKMYVTGSDSLGRYNFDGLMLYGNRNVKLASVNDKGGKKGTFMVDTVLPMKVSTSSKQNIAFDNIADSIAKTGVEKRIAIMQKANVAGITRLKEVTIKASQTVNLASGPMTTWGTDQVFNITPADYQYKNLQWFLLQNTKGATTPVTDPNRRIVPNKKLELSEPGKYNIEAMEFLRPLTGVAYMGVDTFEIHLPSVYEGSSYYRYISKVKPLPPQLIVNGQELYMDEYDQAEAYRNTWFYMPLNKFKKIVLKHVTGILHGNNTPLQAETITVDRYLLYLTLTDDAMTDNPGSKSVDINGYYEARTFYQPPPNAKPSVSDFRTTIHWEPNVRTDANGKAVISFYNAMPKTSVRVIVQGVTDGGVPLSASTGYVVQ